MMYAAIGCACETIRRSRLRPPMLTYWQTLELPQGSTLAAWGMIALLSLAAVALSFWLRRRFGR
jgi:hypothetical protein